jgi:hypothetical protein
MRLRCPRQGVASFALAPLCGDLGVQKKCFKHEGRKDSKGEIARSDYSLRALLFLEERTEDG